MIIARSPLRISFAGGGSDIPSFYRNYSPGVVVSTSIQKYVYVSINKKFDGKVSVRYRAHEQTDDCETIKHPLVREALLYYGIKAGIEIVISSDVPARGSGLGASSALACALIAALERWDPDHLPENLGDKMSLAEVASHIEIEKVLSPIGKQDHYSSAIGGLNMLQFNADDSVEVTPFMSESFLKEIESQSMLFYLKIEHDYHQGSFVQKILKDQNDNMPKSHKIYELQRDNALRMFENMSYEVPERFMDHVNENWRLKKTTHPEISSGLIDDIIQRAYSKGATAAKVCGAGGGGFLYLLVPPSMQEDVRGELEDYPELPVRFDRKGTEVIFDDTERMASAKI